MVYHDRPDIMLINGSAGITVDIGLKVDNAFHGDSMLQSLPTPAGRVAWARYQGPYAMLPVIHTDIRAWCIDRGHRITGLSWDHYSLARRTGASGHRGLLPARLRKGRQFPPQGFLRASGVLILGSAWGMPMIRNLFALLAAIVALLPGAMPTVGAELSIVSMHYSKSKPVPHLRYDGDTVAGDTSACCARSTRASCTAARNARWPRGAQRRADDERPRRRLL